MKFAGAAAGLCLLGAAALLAGACQQREELERTAAEVRDRFEAVLQSVGVGGEYRSATGVVDDLVTLHGRYADLTVIGQRNPESGGAVGGSPTALESLMFETGRPVLAVPYAGRFDAVGRRIMVAWSATRESARAVADALPLLKQADSVVTFAVNPRRGREEGTHGDIPGADIAVHLARHDVKVEAQHTVTEDVSIGDMLLSRAADESVDLIVMGAYGHSRMRELVLGGVTRHLLAHMTVPVLLAH